MPEPRPARARDWSGFRSAFLGAFPIALGVVAALFALFGPGRLSPGEAVDLASSYLGNAGNAVMLRSAAEGRADARISGTLILLAAVAQSLAFWRGTTWADLRRPDRPGLAAALVLALAIGGGALAYRGKMVRAFEANSRAVAVAEEAEGARRVRESDAAREAAKRAADEHFRRELRHGLGRVPMRDAAPRTP